MANLSTTGATVDTAEGISPTLRLSARSVISTVGGDASTLNPSLSFNSLLATASTLLNVNIGQVKEKISSNPDLVHFFIEYFISSIGTSLFFADVKDSLQKARKAQLLIQEAFILFEYGRNPLAELEKLREFMEEGNPFTEKFVEEFKIVVELQNSTLQDLRQHKKELNRKLGSVKAWRKVWNIVYSAAFAAVSICAVVLAAVAAPPAATAAAAAASGAMAPMQQWVDSIWDQFQSPYEVEKDIIDSLKEGTKLAIHELDCIRALVEELKIKISLTIHDAGFAIEEEEEAALKVVMREIKLKAGTFAKSVEDLVKEVDRCDAELKTTTAAILEAVTD